MLVKIQEPDHMLTAFAVDASGSPNTLAHSVKLKLVVMTRLVRA